MGSSAPPSIHYGTVNGQVVRDIHDDGDFPDGTLHLALIYMGRYRVTPKFHFVFQIVKFPFYLRYLHLVVLMRASYH